MRITRTALDATVVHVAISMTVVVEISATRACFKYIVFVTSIGKVSGYMGSQSTAYTHIAIVIGEIVSL